MQTKLPPWIEALESPKKDLHARIFYIRLAALMLTPGGSLPDLSSRLGYNMNYFTHLISERRRVGRALVTPEDAIRLETMLGRDLMPRECLRPDMFLIPDAPPG